MEILKKDGLTEDWNSEKIILAIMKASERIDFPITRNQAISVSERCRTKVQNLTPTSKLHSIVINTLQECGFPEIAEAYQEYRDYKNTYAKSWEHLKEDADTIIFLGDRENANFDSSLVSTKGSLIKGTLTKELYNQFYLSKTEKFLTKRGDIYIHDLRDMIFGSINCCLFDIKNVLKNGFVMSGVRYSEPKTVSAALQVIGDITLVATAQQFGGFTLPEIDKVLLPYALKSFNLNCQKYAQVSRDASRIEEMAMSDTIREIEQGFQGLELKLNTVPCSRGDFAFTTLTFGQWDPNLDYKDRYWLKTICQTILKVRERGHNGFMVVFPKLVYLYDASQIETDPLSAELFDIAVKTSSHCMYPDYLSLSGNPEKNKVSKEFRDYGVIISPMGALAGHEHLTVKIDEKVYDISIKDFYEYCKTGVLNAHYLGEENREWVEAYGTLVKVTDPKLDVTNFEFTIKPPHIAYKNCEVIIKENSSIGDLFDQVEPCTKVYKKFRDDPKTGGLRERPVFEQSNIPQDLIDLNDRDIKVLDRNNKWVKILHVFKNDKNNTPLMMHVFYMDGDKQYMLSCTEDHPLWNGETFVRTDQLKPGNSIYRADGKELKVTDVSYHWTKVDSYDIGTATGTFVGSDIIMHNCRAFLSHWEDPETHQSVTVGRCNIGAVSLNLPIIMAVAKREYGPNWKSAFWDLLSSRLETIRGFLKKRYEIIKHTKCSTNPLAFTQGGLHNGFKNPDDEVGDLIDYMTASFGITALNEATILWTGNSLYEDKAKIANKIVDFIVEKVEKFKKEDNHLYAIYGTPAESLCMKQAQQYKELTGDDQFGEYFSNSFHCHVSECITPIEKQNTEFDCFHKVSGGHIQYVRVDNPENLVALKAIIKRGMDMGFYQGVNFDCTTCNDCGKTSYNTRLKCPHCGSENVNTISRVCGYLGYSNLNGQTRMNDGKMQEINDRISM